MTAKGFVFMDTPGYDPVSATGQVAGGANILCFTTGRGSAYGCKPTPSIKLATNTAIFERMAGDMDINCGDVLDGVSIQDKGREIFDTILRVSQAIVDRQRAFFDHGEVAMRPLTLREIAETVSLHESTISRVTTQKYLASPRGIFELKYFFGSHVATDTGGAASSTAIRALIKQLVDAEDGKKPLSDARLAEILGEQGIVVARRTVAKYRELLGIPPVNLRKAL